MPARHKNATMLLALRPRLPATERDAPAPERQAMPPAPEHFDATECGAWRAICERRLWTDALALWAECFASLLATSRQSNDDNAKPNRAQLRLFANDLRQLLGDEPAPTERNPFDDI